MAIKAKGGISLPKTIFGTTEKSNFILNMKTEKYWDFNLKILLGFMILMPVLSIPLEFARTYSLPLIALAIAGVAAIVFTFIGFMKSVTPKKLWVLTGILAAMVVWGYVSLMNSFCAGDAYNYNVATFGFDGRGEGLLSILFYGCFFMLGAQLGTDSNRRKLLNGMLLMGLAECIWGLLQALPIGFKSYYQNLEPMLLFRTFLLLFPQQPPKTAYRKRQHYCAQNVVQKLRLAGQETPRSKSYYYRGLHYGDRSEQFLTVHAPVVPCKYVDSGRKTQKVKHRHRHVHSHKL